MSRQSGKLPSTSPGFQGSGKTGGPPSRVPFLDSLTRKVQSHAPKRAAARVGENHPGCSQPSAVHRLGRCKRRGPGREPPRLPPAEKPFDASARAGGAGLPAKGIRSRVFPPPLLELPGRPGGCACAPAPSPGGRRASDSGGGDGAERETRRLGEGRCLHLAPVRRPGPGRAGLDPRQPRRSGGGGEPPASSGGGLGPGRGNLPLHRSGGGDACGGRSARRPLPEPRWAGSPGRSPLSSCRKFQKLSIIPAQRAARAAKAPRRRATCRPAERPRGPPSPPPSPTRRGSHVARPAAPSRALGTAECVAAPAGGYFEREGSRPAAVFLAFSWPPSR